MKNSENEINQSFKRFANGLYTEHDAELIFEEAKTEIGFMQIAKEMDDAWESIQVVDNSDTDKQQYRQEAKQLLKKIKQKNRFPLSALFRKYSAIAAILLLAILGTYFLISKKKQQPILYTEIKVPYGERKEIRLPDGSSVTLNAGSYMRYPTDFMSEERLVEIDGEAFFDVTKDPRKPFVVKTQDVHIQVLGTSFNVKAYNADEELSVCVQTGKVDVGLDETCIILLPDEELVLDKVKNEFKKRKQKADNVKSWIGGTLHFNRTPVRSVIKELERIYNCKISFVEGAEYDDYIYGEHDNKTLEAVLSSIQYSTNIKYKKQGSSYLLYK